MSPCCGDVGLALVDGAEGASFGTVFIESEEPGELAGQAGPGHLSQKSSSFAWLVDTNNMQTTRAIYLIII